MANQPGLFIAFEGADAAGCTTHASLLAQRLEARGVAVRLVQPGTSELMRKAHPALWADPATGPLTLALAAATDLADLAVRQIEPALAAGMVVIADRYSRSLQARCLLRGLERAWLETAFAFAPAPGLCLWLTCPPVERLRRALACPDGPQFRAAGLDIGCTGDRGQAFLRYQGRLDQRLAALLAGERQVQTTAPARETHARIWNLVEEWLAGQAPARPRSQLI